MSYYLGLSVLSNIPNSRHTRDRQKLLSAEAWNILSRLAGRFLAENDIARDDQGRPFSPTGDFDFSISHSGGLAVVSLIKDIRSNTHTGCDIELVRPRTRAKEIAESFFSVPERDYVLPQGFFDETRFYEIWTLKECLLKLWGLSVFDMAKVPSFICGEGTYRGHFIFDAIGASPLTFYLYELSGANERYILATAIEGIGTEPEIRWFSQISLSCRIIAKINVV